ncbi:MULTISPECIES: DUF3592 domain-containing protein [unclassified Streptomyces]|uniref:DUF3592 domain-containing protein n=1 Tax=unclassified Streptomyces TaxID=2593676 RepID=UPI00093ED88C|nr:DUF3592 domain-containing protein [Streptomyces sp. TSRI0107]OKJ72696.1 hypothetical protein AMK31_33730 [Streptomyces sp. TSRI0107]
MSQILHGRRVSAKYDSDAVRIEHPDRQVGIPLAVVREVRTPEPRVVEIVLTDGAVHRVEGGNPTATAAFAAALTGVLPALRDPAGSALVTTDESREPRLWWVLTPLVLLVLAYLGYAGWVAATHGARILGVVVGLVPLAIGLLGFLGGIEEATRRAALARRGISVHGYATGRRKKTVYYSYTDADGGVHTYSCRRNVQRTEIVYDPRQPSRAAHAQWLPFLLMKLFLMIFGGAVWLFIGVVMVFGVLW